MRRRRVAAPPRATDFWPFGGMILMAATLFLYGASGLVAPWWAVVVLLVLWLALFVLACSWWSSHPRRITVLALGALALWFASLVAGASLLGWSA
ncbi:hypothetical protein FE634_13365 [Nocardioides dongxiaopingii]|uniref:hypothetical protein n=1 Tax=Nocardioides TaxID=1839 RepID=UPI0010C76AC8|nr:MULTISPECIES: hypothetical protein [Nocardioides]QCW51146.1 hypothetical protein FE634_13365 [Nocardioides sp. S-1144]